MLVCLMVNNKFSKSHTLSAKKATIKFPGKMSMHIQASWSIFFFLNGTISRVPNQNGVSQA